MRYLLKEDDSLDNSIEECLDTITDRMNEEEAVCEFEFQNGKKRILADAILYVESRLHKVIFFIMEDEVKEYSRYDRLDTVERELQQYGFCRVHQSFLVNMKYAKGVERYKVSLEDGTEVSISNLCHKAKGGKEIYYACRPMQTGEQHTRLVSLKMYEYGRREAGNVV